MTTTPHDAGAEIQRIFEQESGKPVLACASSEFSGYATIKVASAASPAHVLQYKPEMESELPYPTAFHCGLAMRSILAEPQNRFDVAATAAVGPEFKRLIEEYPGKSCLNRRKVVHSQAPPDTADGLNWLPSGQWAIA